MKTGWGILLIISLLLTGCATGYPGAASGPPGGPLEHIPGWWYNNDPALKQWYEFPYMNYESPG